MQTVLILKGLPASGKSTYAKELVDKYKGANWKRINKDDLRAMLDNSNWSKYNEKFILKVRDHLIEQALLSGYNIVVDDTNLSPKHYKTIKDIVLKLNTYHSTDIEIDTKLFDTPVEECIQRDLKRPVSVGEKVIRDMYNKYLRPDPEEIKYLSSLPDAIICDIDGTLAIMKNRGPFDWDKVDQDDYKVSVRNILLSIQDSHKIIIFSGRDSICYEKTEDWLMCTGIPFDKLYMRPKGDMRKDSIVKKEMFDLYVRGKYNIDFVLDDRNQVVDMWRNELGLTCLQVAEGDF